MFTLALVTALGCALLAGAFVVFSAMVMPALGRLPAPQAIAAMQAINAVATRLPFLVAFGVAALLQLGRPSSVCYLAGAAADDAEGRWVRYRRGWTAWNHTRAAASLAATGALIGGVSAG